MKWQIKGRVKINAEGRGLSRFINAVHHSGLRCSEQYISGGRFSGEIRPKDLERFRELAESCGAEFHSFEYDTLSSRLRRRRYRIGFIAGAVIAAALLLWNASVVSVVEVVGNSRVSTGTILSALEEVGIRRGTRIRDINFIQCENRLQVMTEGISWVGMHRSGSRIVVEVTETVEKPEMVSSRLPCNILAAHSAEIVSMNILDGKALYSPGDYVPEGSLLVSGVTTDDTGRTILHHAMGTVIGKYQDMAVLRAPAQSMEWQPDGSECVRRKLIFFGVELPLFFTGKEPEGGVSEKSVRFIRLFGREMPVGIETSRTAGTVLTVTEFTPEQQRDILRQKLFIYEKNFLSGDIQILTRDLDYSSTGDTLTVRYTLQGDICRQREIYVR